MHNPEIERRSGQESGEALSIRAQHVLADYFLEHPDNELGKMLQEGVISPERAYKSLLQQARDPLTKMQRRDILPYVLKYEMWLAREKGQAFSIGFFDVDDFGRINKDFDHSTGDEVLKRSAQVILNSTRKTDDIVAPDSEPSSSEPAEEEVARHGGEEFLVIYPGTTRENSMIPAEKLRESFSEQLRDAVPDHRPLTISGGVVEYDPERHATWEDILKEGSELVLAAKKAGKNRIVFTDERSKAA